MINIINYFFIFVAEYLYLLAGLIALLWFWKLPKNQKREAAIFSLVVLPAIYLVSRVAAVLYFNPRPFVVGHFTPLISHSPDNGFPSDHVLLVSALAAIIYPFSKKISAVIWFLAFLVGLSRVYVGVHHPLDIIGSILISIIISMLIYFIFQRYLDKHIIVDRFNLNRKVD